MGGCIEKQDGEWRGILLPAARGNFVSCSVWLFGSRSA